MRLYIHNSFSGTHPVKSLHGCQTELQNLQYLTEMTYTGMHYNSSERHPGLQNV